MTLTRGHKIIIIVAGGLVAIGLLIYFGFFYGRTPSPAELSNKVYGPEEAVPTKIITFTPPPLTDMEVLESKLQVLSRTFAERFGTYSNQGNGRLAAELQPMMTSKFYEWVADTYSNKLRSEYSNGGAYSSIVTTADTVEVIEATSATATVTVMTSRIKKADGQTEVTTQESLKLEYVKNGDSWLVDGAYWEN